MGDAIQFRSLSGLSVDLSFSPLGNGGTDCDRGHFPGGDWKTGRCHHSMYYDCRRACRCRNQSGTRVETADPPFDRHRRWNCDRDCGRLDSSESASPHFRSTIPCAASAEIMTTLGDVLIILLMK